MTVDELRDKRFVIIFEALTKGLDMQYKRGWTLSYFRGILSQSFYNKDKKEDITHKSAVSLQDFLNFCSNLEDSKLKELYGMIKLFDLQEKLIKKEN